MSLYPVTWVVEMAGEHSTDDEVSSGGEAVPDGMEGNAFERVPLTLRLGVFGVWVGSGNGFFEAESIDQALEDPQVGVHLAF